MLSAIVLLAARCQNMFRLTPYLLCGVMFSACAPRATLVSQSVEDPQLILSPLPAYRGVEDCAAPTRDLIYACRIPVAPSSEELEANLADVRAAAWNVGDRWTIAAIGPAGGDTTLWVMGGIQLPMSRIAGTSIWSLTLHLPGADRAVIDLSLSLRQGFMQVGDAPSIKPWRGGAAPAAPTRASEIRGVLSTDTIFSAALQEDRRITTYVPPVEHPDRELPVVYLADGRIVNLYATYIDEMIAMGTLRPVALVGIWPGRRPRSDGPPRGIIDDWRAVEYLTGVSRATETVADSIEVEHRHAAHDVFFTEEVPRWAESTLGVSGDPELRAVQGVSNGAEFAVMTARRHSNDYGAIIAFSHSTRSALSPPADGWGELPMHFLAVGSVEPGIAPFYGALADSLAAAGVVAHFELFPSGHDSLVWAELFPKALAWWFDRRMR